MEYTYDDLAARLRRTIGVGPAGIALSIAWFLVVLFLLKNVAFSVLLAAILAAILFATAFQNPTAVTIGIVAGRTTADMLWWVSTGGTLRGVQQVYSAIAFATAALFVAPRVQFLSASARALLAIVATFAVLGTIQIPTRAVPEQVVRLAAPWVLMLLVMSHATTQRDRRRVLDAIVASLAIPVVITAGQYLTGSTRYYLFDPDFDRVIGPFEDFATNANMLVVAIPLFAFYADTVPRNAQKLLWLALAGVAAIAMFYTYVRATLIGVGIFAIVWLLLRRRYSLVGLIGVFSGIAALESPFLQRRFQDLLLVFQETDERELHGLGSGRIGIWRTTIDSLQNRDLFDLMFGTGLGTQFEAGGGFDAHNEYLSILVQLGPIALFAYVAGLVVIGSRVWRYRATATGWDRQFADVVLAMFVMTLAMNFLSNAFFSRPSPTWLWHALVGLMLSGLKEREDELGIPASRRLLT